MTRLIVFIFGLMALCGNAYANGQSTSTTSVKGMGNPVPRKMVDVELISEHLTIKPMGFYTQVKVKYLLWNKSDKDFNNIDYAFPIDYYDNYDDTPTPKGGYLEKFYYTGWSDEYVKNVAFWDDGKMVPYQKADAVKVEKGYVGKWQDDQIGSNVIPSISRKWHYIQFSIPKHSFKTLEVQYDVVCSHDTGPQEMNTYYDEHYDDMYITNGYLWRLDPTIYSQFTYDFSPAYTWGSGKVGSLFIEVDTTEMPNNTSYNVYDYLSKYDYWSTNDLYRFVKTNKGFSCSLRDFAFKDKPTLRLNFSTHKSNYQIELGGMEQLLRYKMPYGDYSISASKVQARYPLSNLSDMDPATAFVFSGNGTGDCITIKFKKPTIVKGILLMGGYYKNKKTFDENSRLKAMFLTSSADGFIEKFAFGLVDAPQYPNKQIPFWNQLLANMLVCQTEFKDIQRLKPSPVTEIRLYPKEVFEGSKYSDLCISELFVLQ